MKKKSYCEKCGKRTYKKGERQDKVINRCEIRISKDDSMVFIDVCFDCADEIKKTYKLR